MRRFLSSARFVLAFGVSIAALASPAGAQFVTFETGQVRPLALSPDQSQLFAVNTPDGRLEIFDVDGGTGALTHSGSVPVGREPVAVAAPTSGSSTRTRSARRSAVPR